MLRSQRTDALRTMGNSEEVAPQQRTPPEPASSEEQRVPVPSGQPIWTRIKRHKVAEWTLAYAAFGYALLHGIEIVGHAFEWPGTVSRFTIYVLLLGIPVAATLAYYHGHKAQHRVSRIEISILAALLTIAGSALWFLSGSAHDRPVPALTRSATTTAPTNRPPFSPPARSVAVLPFVDMSERHDQEYFADGLSEELIDHLSRSPELRVIARNSSFYFKGRQATVNEIATTLNVGYLLEGSVRRSGKTVRIAAQLVRATDGTNVWAATYDHPFSEIFGLQTNIASQVAAALDATLVGTSDRAHGTKSLEAYSEVLEGQFYATRRNKGDLSRAVQAYSRAVELDPGYTHAWIQLGRAYLSQGVSGELERGRAERLAIQAVGRALTIEPDSAPAHRLMGNIDRVFRWDWNAASAEYQRALRVADDPNERLLVRLEIQYLNAIRAGHYSDEYWKLLEESLIRNPLDTALMHELAFDYLYSGQNYRAVELFRRALTINPTGDQGNANLAYALMLAAKFAEGYAAAQHEPDEESRNQVLAMLTWSMGNHRESDHYLAGLERDAPDAGNFYTIAQIYAWRGERDLAISWLERAYSARADAIMTLRLDPLLTSLRQDERYRELLRKMRLAD